MENSLNELMENTDLKWIFVGGKGGVGKCLGRGTPVLMIDGRFKNVEDVHEGDILMGDDGTPRNVLSTVANRAPMYQVSMSSCDPFTCNGDHLLTCSVNAGPTVCTERAQRCTASWWTLTDGKPVREAVECATRDEGEALFPPHALVPGRMFEVTVDDYMTLEDEQKAALLMHHTGLLEFHSTATDCPADWSPGPSNTTVPEHHKYGSSEARMTLLAKYIDAVGSLDASGSTIKLLLEEQTLREDITFIARSLGFLVTKCEDQHCVCISGNIAQIPCKYKPAPVQSGLDVSAGSFTVTAVGVDDYFGFQIDGNHRFVITHDFIITHNTTDSCAIACQLALRRESVLLISTDPAHNLSDAFGQKFGKDPTKVKSFARGNLFAMEVDAQAALTEQTAKMSSSSRMGSLNPLFESMNKFFSEGGSNPGIDEMVSFGKLVQLIDSMEYSVVVFDTAPTGHTLRFLALPDTVKRALGMIKKVQETAGPMISAISGMAGMPPDQMFQALSSIDPILRSVERISAQFRDPVRTTFICICIPEFLSVYETERLVQQLAVFEMDCHNVVVNFVHDASTDPKLTPCKMCRSRATMQQKYIRQINGLYGEDFNVILSPLRETEVRGVPDLLKFGEWLVDPKPLCWQKKK
eukprot:gnl/Dysnectes_brevis/2115_a2457_1710.p1 GENE.gnl/Dysnectes_brevis/2115_a2457_1710~~gnl/Dysnectes_brevis/2115_a2457_1710.p1  ORF type:complete len:638 (+),score=204.94 gnl/Dysnectes_brevis/2115_a2457_1710:1172-3085(+)